MRYLVLALFLLGGCVVGDDAPPELPDAAELEPDGAALDETEVCRLENDPERDFAMECRCFVADVASDCTAAQIDVCAALAEHTCYGRS